MATVNDTIREHELAETDWEYNRVLLICHEVLRRVVEKHFHGSLTTALLLCKPTNKKTHVKYVGGTNGASICYEMVINSKKLGKPLWMLICAVIHATVHQYQELHGGAGAGSYHNRNFREMAEQCGVHCEAGTCCTPELPISDEVFALVEGILIDGKPLDLYAPAMAGVEDEDEDPLPEEPLPVSTLNRYDCRSGCGLMYSSKLDRKVVCSECGRPLVRTNGPLPLPGVGLPYDPRTLTNIAEMVSAQ